MPGKNISLYCFAILLQIPVPFTYGQTDNLKDPSYESVYVQTDRSIYFADEPILFNAFILNDLSSHYKTMSDTLLIAVIDQDGLEVASGEFPVSNYATTGDIMLSKYLTDGNYVLIAGTKRMKDLTPDKIFSKIVEIRVPRKQDEIFLVKLNNDKYIAGEELTANIFIKDKMNKPVSTSFSWVLTGPKGEITDGKGKTDEDGKTILQTKLPDLQNNESYKLIFTSSGKGDKIRFGVVIPTGDHTGMRNQADKTKINNPLNITLSTDQEQYTKNEETTCYIAVTDEQGKPLYADLSVSASDFFPLYFPLNRDNIITCSNLKTSESGLSSEWASVLDNINRNPIHEIINYKVSDGNLFNSDLASSFGLALSQFVQTPGQTYFVQEKNDLKKIRKKQASQEKEKTVGYSADRNIYDIIRRIKPYQIVDGKIMFSNAGNFSVNFQNGALIVVDGVKMGTDVTILNNLPVTEIARITATTNPSELQRYSALNSSGLIEITMKKGNSLVDKMRAAEKRLNSSILWKPDLTTDTSGKAKISFSNDDSSGRIILTVQGVTSDGLTANCSIQYEVK